MMKIIDLVPSWAYAIVVGALLVALGVSSLRLADAHVDLANARTEMALEKKDREVERRARAVAALRQSEANARETFRRIEVAADKERARNESTQVIQRRLDAALGELRQRPERPDAGRAAAPASDPATTPACTGTGLYRGDAEFLTRFAARAAVIAAERDYCHERYDSLSVPK